jgi:hypothetical protein
MWIAKSNNWNPSAKPLEKFAIERILQRCDYTEIISNKYRTINGYTQIKEVIHYCEVTLRRSKTVKTLMMIIEEAQSPLINQNILNDLIIGEYFQDLRDYFMKEINSTRLVVGKMQPNLLALEILYKDLQIFEKQLEERYFECLVIELKKVNYDESEQIHRELRRLSALIDLLIPYLIFKGYSNATISEILRYWLKAGYHITVSKFLSFLHFKKRPFTFLQFLGTRSAESNDFLTLMRKGLEVEIEEIPAENLRPEFLEANSIPSEGIFAKYEFSTLDPHKHVRSNFDRLLKDLVIQRERQSLAVFNSFFNHSFWSNRSGLPFERFKTISLEGDPINVNVRGRTLRKTLEKASKARSFEFTSETHIPITEFEQLSNSVYYYNLALGSKSIENSISLLWTALEAVQPYKVYSADIDAVQKLVSKGLGIGSVGRDINGFASRLHQFSSLHENSLVGQFQKKFPSNFYPDDLLNWFYWICDEPNCVSNFEILKNHSELLAFQYSALGKSLVEGKLSYLLNRINRSENSMKFQLQRIYHHRNKIVHSGDMINEYTNLWMHLEWYIGKILAYFIIKLYYEKSSNSLEDAFMELEADRDYLVSYLEQNMEKKISELSPRILELMFKHNWQFF